MAGWTVGDGTLFSHSCEGTGSPTPFEFSEPPLCPCAGRDALEQFPAARRCLQGRAEHIAGGMEFSFCEHCKGGDLGTEKWFPAETAPGSRNLVREGEGGDPRNVRGGGIRAPPCHPLQCKHLSCSSSQVSSPTQCSPPLSASQTLGHHFPSQQLNQHRGRWGFSFS